jgi:site-specific DNA-methyltransferase (adenine-specific)
MAGRFTAQAEYIIWGTSGGHNPDKKTAIYLPGVFQIPVPPMTEREHSTQKPTQLLEEIVKVAPFGETVLDPFMGSGTTGVACINLGRKFVGVEIERKYFDIACERIAAANRQERLFADLDAGANGIRQSDLLA